MTMPETALAEIRTRIDENILQVGDNLSSIRAAAKEFGVLKKTIVEAYDRLLAASYVKARQGTGSPSSTGTRRSRANT